MSRKKADHQTDRERILLNIAGMLASELASIQNIPAVKQYMETRQIRAEWFCEDLKKGDLVVCGSSAGGQQNPWIVSFVEERGIPGDPRGCLLRAIGTDKTCNYGNESFTKITGIPERLLWEGDKQIANLKIHAALHQFDDHKHRFRGLEFEADGIAHVFIGPHIWYMDKAKPVRPYRMTIHYDKKTSVKNIVSQMEEQGMATREFDPDDGAYDGPMENCATFTRTSLIKSLAVAGIEIKEQGAQ